MDLISDLLKVILPAAAVLYGMYLMVRSFIKKEIDSKKLEIKENYNKTTLPMRLQAYERVCLLLERIAPNNLVVRLNDANYSAAEFHQVLLSEIRNEYYHNLSQQVYISDQAWDLARSAVEEVISIVNKAAQQLSEKETRSIDLARKIFEQTSEQDNLMATKAIYTIKEEARTFF